MRIISNKILAPLLLLLFTLSCNKERIPKCKGDCEHEKIEGDVLVEATKESTILLKVKTERDYECQNYYVDNCFKIDRNLIRVNILGSCLPGVCLTAIGPAKADIDLGDLNNGEYQVNFYHNDQVSKAQLNVSDQDVKLEFFEIQNVKAH